MTSTRTPRVVTLSATYGAGGTLIAPRLAQRLDLPFADRLVPMTGARAPASAEGVTDEEVREEPRNPLLQGLALLSTAWRIPVPRDPEDIPERLRAHVEASIDELLADGGAVILGRAAAVVLGRRPGALHVRLDGPEDARAARGAAWEGVELEAARSHLRDTDTKRARYLHRLYGRDSDDPSLYHVVLDTTVLTVDVCVDVLALAAEAFWAAASG